MWTVCLEVGVGADGRVRLGGQALVVTRHVVAEQIAVELRVRRQAGLTREHLGDAQVLVGHQVQRPTERLTLVEAGIRRHLEPQVLRPDAQDQVGQGAVRREEGRFRIHRTTLTGIP